MTGRCVLRDFCYRGAPTHRFRTPMSVCFVCYQWSIPLDDALRMDRSSYPRRTDDGGDLFFHPWILYLEFNPWKMYLASKSQVLVGLFFRSTFVSRKVSDLLIP